MTAERLFIALPLPADVKQVLTARQTAWQRVLPANSMRWVDATHLHLTLLFLGAVDARHVPGITSVMTRTAQRTPVFTLELGPAGAFPSLVRPGVVWQGVAGDVASVSRLHTQLSTQLLAFHANKQRFHPHITLGRLRGMNARAPLQALLLEEVQRVHWQVTELQLIRSSPGTGKQASRTYTVLSHAYLKDA